MNVTLILMIFKTSMKLKYGKILTNFSKRDGRASRLARLSQQELVFLAIRMEFILFC